jgi:hypothetical protein
MNDDELITSVRESFTGVRSATPVERIVSRSRAVRARRRTPALAGAAAVLAGTALAVTTLVPSGHPGVEGSRHPGSPLANARLAAWTVHKQANGDIDIHIRQLKNPAGLQATLRADGVPVNVGFNGQSLKGTCQFYPMNNNVLNAVAEVTGASRADGGTLFVINPSALPAGAGLAMEVGQTVTHLRVGGHWDRGIMSVQFTTPVPMPSSLPPGTGGGVGTSDLSSRHGVLTVLNSLSITPVYASQQCTG